MASTSRKEHTELMVLEMLERNGLPQPDRVEYGEACIRLFWEATKVVLIVDFE